MPAPTMATSSMLRGIGSPGGIEMPNQIQTKPMQTGGGAGPSPTAPPPQSMGPSWAPGGGGSGIGQRLPPPTGGLRTPPSWGGAAGGMPIQVGVGSGGNTIQQPGGGYELQSRPQPLLGGALDSMAGQSWDDMLRNQGPPPGSMLGQIAAQRDNSMPLYQQADQSGRLIGPPPGVQQQPGTGTGVGPPPLGGGPGGPQPPIPPAPGGVDPGISMPGPPPTPPQKGGGPGGPGGPMPPAQGPPGKGGGPPAQTMPTPPPPPGPPPVTPPGPPIPGMP